MRAALPARSTAGPAVVRVTVGVGRDLARVDADVFERALVERRSNPHCGAPALPLPVGLPGPGKPPSETPARCRAKPAIGGRTMSKIHASLLLCLVFPEHSATPPGPSMFRAKERRVEEDYAGRLMTACCQEH